MGRLLEQEKVQHFFRQDFSGEKFEIAPTRTDILSTSYLFDKIDILRSLVCETNDKHNSLFSRIINIWFVSRKVAPSSIIQDLYDELLGPFIWTNYKSTARSFLWQEIKSGIYSGDIKKYEIDEKLIDGLIDRGLSSTAQNTHCILEDFVKTFSEIGEDLSIYIYELGEAWPTDPFLISPTTIVTYDKVLSWNYRKQLALNGIFTSRLHKMLSGPQIQKVQETKIPKNFYISETNNLGSILYEVVKRIR